MVSDLQILLVNSNAKARSLINRTLQSAGYRHVYEAENGRAAVQILGRKPIDLLITDVDISPLDGWRLGRLVRAGVFLCQSTIPLILVVSTWCERIAETTAREFGFNAVLPLDKYELLPQAVSDCSSAKGVGLQQPRLLVVEDFSDTAHLIKRILGPRFEIEVAEDGFAGLEAWMRGRHELVLLDVMLPGMSGPDVLREILKVHPAQPVVIMTAYGNMELAEQLMLAGAADFIVKPFTAEPLRRVVDIALKREDYLISNAQFAAKVQSLREAQDALEDRIRQRTESLEKTNTLLRNEVLERKKAEQELEQARRAAEAANEAKSRFLANMSHEIRTPINGILGMAEIALDSALDEQQRHLLRTIYSEADSLLGIINDVLDLSKVEAGKMELESIPFDLRNLVEDLANSMAFRARQKDIAFICHLAPRVPSRLIGDPVRLRQILLNLCSNAIKFTPAGEVILNILPDSDSGERVRLRILVKDTGIGIPRERQSLIFESFRQADSSTTRKFGGTGLGTTIAKQLTELMGGQIGFESEEGRGTTFWFELEFIKQKQSLNQALKRQPELQGLRVLLVNDRSKDHAILKAYLEDWGCQPTALPMSSCAETLLQAGAEKERIFDFIILDFQSFERENYCFVQRLRSQEGLRDVPIIALVALGAKGDGERCRDIGMKAYLTKPVKSPDLRTAIGMVLSQGAHLSRQAGTNLITRHDLKDSKSQDIQILLVEDYPTNQQVAIKYLESAGYTVVIAENGRIAVESFKQKHFKLILMDIDMPIMNGYEATAAIRALEQKARHANGPNQAEVISRVPIVAMTANALCGDRETCLDKGMDDYIAKPLRRSDLLALVEKWTASATAPGLARRHDPDRAICTTEVMDYDGAVAEFMGDEAFLHNVLQGFIRNVDEQVVQIRQAIVAEDAETVRKEAHAIKGGAANLLAVPLSQAAKELEALSCSAQHGTMPAVFDRLVWEFNRLKSTLDARQNLNTNG